jgi:hypothetical protein
MAIGCCSVTTSAASGRHVGGLPLRYLSDAACRASARDSSCSYTAARVGAWRKRVVAALFHFDNQLGGDQLL